jgi:hypothetical protein
MQGSVGGAADVLHQGTGHPDQPAGDADPEHGVQHEIAGPKAADGRRVRGDDPHERETLHRRLQQIKAELTADRNMGAATVELFGGEPTRLIDLVQRVGKAKQQESQG